MLRINELEEQTGISKANIYPIVNFKGELSFPNPHLSYFNMNVLHIVLQKAANFIENYNLEFYDKRKNQQPMLVK